MNLVQHAERELRNAGLFDKDSDYGGEVGQAVLELVEIFANQGHSGMSSGLVIHLFSKVASYRTLTPIDNPAKSGEYIACDRAETVWQSTRLSTLFSEDGGRNWYDLNGKPAWWQRPLVWLWRRGAPIPKRWRVAYVSFPLAA